MPSVVIIIGTRPEAIKLLPVIEALKRDGNAKVVTIATGQHTDLLRDTAQSLRFTPDIHLAVHQAGPDLNSLSAALLEPLGARLDAIRPDLVMVQGDTQSAAMGALAAGFLRIATAHVEAGLRSGNRDAPFPEELNRRLIARAAHIHFAPTIGAQQNLLREGVAAADIAVTGNTVVDALRRYLPQSSSPRDAPANRPLLLASCHRRENWDGGVERVAEALSELAQRDMVDILFMLPAAPDPRRVITEHLAGAPGVTLSNALPYDAFLGELGRADLVVTDTGGLQEEAAALGIPAVVMRNESDRPESLGSEGDGAPQAILAGTERHTIVAAIDRLLADPRPRRAGLRPNPFGDGHAAERIVLAVNRWFRGARPLLEKSEQFRA